MSLFSFFSLKNSFKKNIYIYTKYSLLFLLKGKEKMSKEFLRMTQSLRNNNKSRIPIFHQQKSLQLSPKDLQSKFKLDTVKTKIPVRQSKKENNLKNDLKLMAPITKCKKNYHKNCFCEKKLNERQSFKSLPDRFKTQSPIKKSLDKITVAVKPLKKELSSLSVKAREKSTIIKEQKSLTSIKEISHKAQSNSSINKEKSLSHGLIPWTSIRILFYLIIFFI